MNSTKIAYNITIANVYTGVMGGSSTGKFRNVVQYNVTDPYNVSGFDYDTLSMYHYNASGDSQLGVSENSNSPLFTDVNNNDFTLQFNSPLIDAGTDVGLSYFGTAPDIGAYEYGSSSSTRKFYSTNGKILRIGGKTLIFRP